MLPQPRLPPVQILLHPAPSTRDCGAATMNVQSMLNTNNSLLASYPRNMQYEIPHHQVMHHPHDMPGGGHYTHSPNLYVPQNGRIKSENGSERGISPHGSDTASRYSSNNAQQAMHHGYPQNLAGIAPAGIRYPSPPAQMQQNVPTIQHSYHPTDQDTGYTHQIPPIQPQQQDQQNSSDGPASNGGAVLPKAFACSTCSKGFARRSDLARHERIHSGVRPHVCDHPGCGKQFIQRSALTVHSRVHTGEKPHMCERCGKPFSDSSSLARHRRIHSGKRPYKCPYADCQKTFTRRTTLTRHQNHHTGTIEESQAATAAALASRASLATRDSRSDGEEEGASGLVGTPSTGHGHDNTRPTSVSPAAISGPVPGLQRPPGPDSYFMNHHMNNGVGLTGMPPHMRPEMGHPHNQHSPRSISPANSGVYGLGVNGGSRHPSLNAHHPASYPLPNTLEPPTANPSQANSVSGSPHLHGNGGWQSPSHHSVLGGGPPQPNDYPYPGADNGAAQHYVQNPQNLYYQTPAAMHNASRLGQDIWGQHQQ